MICAILWNLESKLELDEEIVLVVERKGVPMEQKKGEVDRIRIHVHWLVLKSAFLSRFYIIILHLKYQ